MEYLTAAFTQKFSDLDPFKDAGELPENSFRGMASVFNGIVDAWIPTIIHKGAFTKTIQERSKDVKILWQHNDWEPIGVPEVLTESEFGLAVQGRISDTQRGRDALTLMRDKVVDALSIGFDVVKADFDYDDKGYASMRHVREVRLWEFSPVTWGADSAARITEVNSLTKPKFSRFSDFPLAQLDEEWDEKLATNRLLSRKNRPEIYFLANKYNEKQDHFILPIAAIKENGDVFCVPKAIFSAAVALFVEGFTEENCSIKEHLDKYFTKIRQELDETILAPWEDGWEDSLCVYTEQQQCQIWGKHLLNSSTLPDVLQKKKAVSQDTSVDSILMDAELQLANMTAESH